MERRKKIEKKKTALILAIVTISLIFPTYFIFNHLTIIETKELNMYLTVGEYVGFNVDPSALFFGTVQPQGSSSRTITISHNYTIPVTVDIRAYGQLAKWVYVSDNDFLLEPNENKTIKVSVTVPENAKFGNYTGILKINFRKV